MASKVTPLEELPDLVPEGASVAFGGGWFANHPMAAVRHYIDAFNRGDQERMAAAFAVPGSIHNPLSRGCHQLLRQGARLVECIDDIFAELAQILPDFDNILSERSLVPTESAAPPLDKDYEILLDALGFEPAGLDTLVARTGLKADAVASMLLILELDGRVQQQPGGRFSRTLPG